MAFDTLRTVTEVLLSDRVVVPDRVVSRTVQGATVLLNMDTGRYFALDEAGTRAWALFAASATLEEARDRLLTEFAADPETLARDLQALAAELGARGLIEIAPRE